MLAPPPVSTPFGRELRAVEVYETDRLDFTEAYLVACAESTGVGRVASFDSRSGNNLDNKAW